MPSSNPVLISPSVQLIIRAAPMSVLDLGIGFGKYGFLCREYLELVHHKVFRRKDWKIRVDGIEVYEPYIQDYQKALYDNIYCLDLNRQDTHEWLSTTDYDLYLAMDVLEHLEDWKGFLKAIPEKSGIIAGVPAGISVQGEVFGNVFETHRHYLEASDLEPFFDEVQTIGGKLLCNRSKKTW